MRQKEEYEHAVRTIENMSAKMEENVKVTIQTILEKSFFLYFLHYDEGIMLIKLKYVKKFVRNICLF